MNENSKRPSRPAPRDGSNIIKGFVQEAEKRRIACRFARTGTGLTPRPPGHRQSHIPSRPHGRVSNQHQEDDRLEIRSGRPTVCQSNQEEDTAAVVEGLFAAKHVPHYRQVSLTPAMLPAAAAAAATGLGVNSKPIFTFTRRKLQMESVNTQAPMAGSILRANVAMLVNPTPVPVTTSQHLGHRPRVSHLAAKLDAILRTSPWMRRKVILQPPVTGQSQRGFSTASSRILSTHSSSMSPLRSHPEGIDVSSGSVNDKHHRHYRNNGLDAMDESAGEMEKRIMATFQRFVRVWRERKRRSEQAAMNIVKGGGSVQQSHSQNPVNANNPAAGRHGSKLRREIDAQSSNVASILSRRMIGEVPALKFFDEGESSALDYAPEAAPVAATAPRVKSLNHDDGEEVLSPGCPKPPPRTLSDVMVSSSLKGSGLKMSPLRRATPRGVCYTLDSTGCRRIKMQSDAAVRTSRAGTQPNDHHKKSEELTVERAMSKSLRRKMVRRVKVKRQAIGRLTDDFRRSKDALTAKLGSQLALREAEGERMFGKRLSLLLSTDAELPPHMAAKELALARLRFRKANLEASCQTLALLGGALHHIETAGEVSGLEISSGEQHFLETLRCAVQGDHAMTPLLIDGILGQFNSEQRRKPLVAGLLGLLERAAPTETGASCCFEKV